MARSNRPATGAAILLQLAGGALLLLATLTGTLVLTSPRAWHVTPRDGLPPPTILLPLVGVWALIGLGLVARRKWGAILLAASCLALATSMVGDTVLHPPPGPVGNTVVLGGLWTVLLALPAMLAWLAWTSLKWR